MRPDLAAQFTKLHGKTPAEFFGTFEYTHKKPVAASSPTFSFHNGPFRKGCCMRRISAATSIMLNRRALIGAFPAL
jgi:hypothetical protein